MAVDTAQKRYSMINFGEDNQMLFEVDSSVDLDDQQHLLGTYSGIAFGSAGKATGILFTTQSLMGVSKHPYGSFAGKTPVGGAFQSAWARQANIVIQVSKI